MSTMKGKAKRVRSASEITYQRELGVIKYKFSLEEETLVQQLGLDRFLSVVTWGVNNPEVMAEVVEGLEITTFETQLNGRKVNIFNMDWRVQMQSVFYLTPHQRNMDAVNSSDPAGIQKLFPHLKGMKRRPENLKISDCRLLEWKKPLRLLNSLLLLRTDASTIPSKFVQRLFNVLNGERVDWREELYDNIRVELITLHQGLYKEGSSINRTMVGPHVVILLAVQGHMTVEQESKAGIWDPFKALEREEQQQKRIKSGTLRGKGSDNDGEKRQNLDEMAGNSKARLVIELAETPEKYEGRDIGTKGVTTPTITNQEKIPQTLPEIAVCTILTQEKEQIDFTASVPAPTRPTTEVAIIEGQKRQDVSTEPGKQQPGTELTSAKGYECIQGLTQQMYIVARRYENLINHATTLASAGLMEELEKKMREYERKEEREPNVEASKKKQGEGTHINLQCKVIELEEQLSDIRKKHIRLQEELTKVHTEAATERLHTTTLLDQTKLIEENHRLKALLAEQQREKEDMQKEVINLHAAVDSQNIINKQTTQEFQTEQEKNRTIQDKLDNAQNTIKELENQVKLYQRKDESYVEALIRAAAFETWVEDKRAAREGVQEFQRRVAETTQDTIQILHAEVERLIQEKEELQNAFETASQAHYALKPEFRRDMDHAMAALHQLPPAVSIQQNFQAFRELVFVSNGIPILATGAKLSQEEVIKFWKRSGPNGRNALAFMWALGELKTPLGVFELVAVNPAFYVSRYCVQAMIQIAEHHRGFYSKTKIREEPPAIYHYNQREMERIQAVIDQNREEFEESKKRFAAEGLSVFTEAVKCHQWLQKYHSDSFPAKFFEIDLQRHVSATLNNFETTVKKGDYQIFNQEMVLTFPALDPRQWKVAKRS